jgi:polysaccharide export outer membrane protein
VIERPFAVLVAAFCLSSVVFDQEPPKHVSKSQPLASVVPERALVVQPDVAVPEHAPPIPAAAEPADAVDPRIDNGASYQIGPEDILDISVWKNPELSRVVPVRPDGKVSLPLVNDIQASGLTPALLRDQVAAKLSEFIPAPEVSVMIREVHSRKVAVVGSVKMPGRFELKSPMTVLEVIALAQGFTDFASRDRIVILRQRGATTTRLPFNYRKLADGAEQENFYVRPGDIVVVP